MDGLACKLFMMMPQILLVATCLKLRLKSSTEKRETSPFSRWMFRQKLCTYGTLSKKQKGLSYEARAGNHGQLVLHDECFKIRMCSNIFTLLKCGKMNWLHTYSWLYIQKVQLKSHLVVHLLRKEKCLRRKYENWTFLSQLAKCACQCLFDWQLLAGCHNASFIPCRQS